MASYQPQPVMQPQAFNTAPPPQPRPGVSKWWPISVFIAAAIFFIVGGGLAGAWTSSSYYYDDPALFQGAIACLAIGGLCKIAGWILLIIYCVQRRRPQLATVAYVNYPLAGYQTAPPQQPGFAPAPPVQSPTPVYPNAQMPPYQQGMGMGPKFCGHCGAPLSSPFCTQCGAKDM
jgi:hypothetical protein